MARRRRKNKAGKWIGLFITALLTFPVLYLLAALVGSLVAVNRGWTEPSQGTTVYIADNGIHADIIMPVKAEGLDWKPLIPSHDFAAAPPDSRWIAFGSGEKHVYLDTPRWRDIGAGTIWSALAGGPRVIHVEYVPSPDYAAREIRLRPEEYRRLWATIRSDFALDRKGRPVRIDHKGYGPADAFYRATGTANAVMTCNAVAARWLRLAGIKASLWPPFISGLTWRYRRVTHHRTSLASGGLQKRSVAAQGGIGLGHEFANADGTPGGSRT